MAPDAPTSPPALLSAPPVAEAMLGPSGDQQQPEGRGSSTDPGSVSQAPTTGDAMDFPLGPLPAHTASTAPSTSTTLPVLRWVSEGLTRCPAPGCNHKGKDLWCLQEHLNERHANFLPNVPVDWLELCKCWLCPSCGKVVATQSTTGLAAIVANSGNQVPIRPASPVHHVLGLGKQTWERAYQQVC